MIKLSFLIAFKIIIRYNNINIIKYFFVLNYINSSLPNKNNLLLIYFLYS